VAQTAWDAERAEAEKLRVELSSASASCRSHSGAVAPRKIHSFHRRSGEIRCNLIALARYLLKSVSSDGASKFQRGRLPVNWLRSISLQWRNSELTGDLSRDVKYAIRTLARTPTFSVVAIAVMALCIGASTSLFTVVRSVLLRPLPFRDPDRLVLIRDCFRASETSRTFSSCGAVSPGDYFDWRAQTHGFQDIASWQWWGFNLSGENGELPEVITAGGATWNLFSVLGVEPAFGRTFTEAEDNLNGNTVMLTWSIFERRFGGDPGIVGREIHLDSKPFTVVGVLPASFTYPDAKVQLWVPYLAVTPAHAVHQHNRHMTRVVARIRPDVGLTEAINQVSAIQHTLNLQYPTESVSDAVSPQSLLDDLGRNVKQPLTLLLCAVLCMLFIGCLNVSNLLLARGATRQHEVAIRSALGAQRLTLIREQLIEIIMVCLSGGGLGVALSLGATQWMIYSWKELPTASSIHIDGIVLGFALLLVLAAALVAGLLPAIASTGKNAIRSLQTSSRTSGGNLSRTAMRKSLLAVEIALTVFLLIAAGLLLKSFVRLRTTDIGCNTDNILTVSYSLPRQKYDSPEKIVAFHEALLDRVRAIPGVLAAGLGETLPGAGNGEDDIFTIQGRPVTTRTEDRSRALVRRADPGYFSAIGIPLLNGRFFQNQDRLDHADKVIVNHELARKYFPGANPVGKRIAIPLWGPSDYEIIGVVGDTIHQIGKPVMESIYFPAFAGNNFEGGVLAVHTATEPLSFSVPIQKQFAALDPELPVSDVLTLQQILGDSVTNASFSATLVMLFAILSLTLASVGLYGVLSYLMTQRTTEMGIRIALGAQRDHVLRLILFDGLRPALFGLAIGLIASATVTRMIQSMLYGVKPLDPMVYVAVACTLLTVATLACIVPAWHASQLDPVQALRAE
jgi:predicted permease